MLQHFSYSTYWISEIPVRVQHFYFFFVYKKPLCWFQRCFKKELGSGALHSFSETPVLPEHLPLYAKHTSFPCSMEGEMHWSREGTSLSDWELIAIDGFLQTCRATKTKGAAGGNSGHGHTDLMDWQKIKP